MVIVDDEGNVVELDADDEITVETREAELCESAPSLQDEVISEFNRRRGVTIFKFYESTPFTRQQIFTMIRLIEYYRLIGSEDPEAMVN